MPIKGLSEIRWIPRVGKVRIGRRVKSKSGVMIPDKLDYFLVRPDEEITTEEMDANFHAVYGDTPRELDILLPFDDSAMLFTQELVMWGSGKGRKCYGNGERAKRPNPATGEIVEVDCTADCPFRLPDEKGRERCKPEGRLKFLLPQVKGLGVWEFVNHSFYTIVQINSSLELISGIMGGRLAMIPLKLIVRPKEVTPRGQSKRTVYVVDIQATGLTMHDVITARKEGAYALLEAPKFGLSGEWGDTNGGEDEGEDGAIVDTEATIIPPAPQAEPMPPITAVQEHDHAGARERVAEKRAAKVAEAVEAIKEGVPAVDDFDPAESQFQSSGGQVFKPTPEPQKVVMREGKMSREDAIEQYGVLQNYAEKLGLPRDHNLVEAWRNPPFTQARLNGIRKALEKQAEPEPEEEGQ